MSAQRTLTTASKPVPILLALSLAAVILASDLPLMATTAMVSQYYLILEN